MAFMLGNNLTFCCSRIVRDISFLCDVLLHCGGLDLAGSRMTTRVDTVVNCF